VPSRADLRAFVVGAGLFAALYFLPGFLVSAAFNSGRGQGDPGAVVAGPAGFVWSLLVFIVPGIVVGLMARQPSLLHGPVLAAFLLPVMFIPAWILVGSWSYTFVAVLYHFAVAALWVTLGVIVGQFIGSRRRRK
jgi:hypothetical protein